MILINDLSSSSLAYLGHQPYLLMTYAPSHIHSMHLIEQTKKHQQAECAGVLSIISI